MNPTLNLPKPQNFSDSTEYHGITSLQVLLQIQRRKIHTQDDRHNSFFSFLFLGQVSYSWNTPTE